MRTVFMGTPEFAAEVLKNLYESDNEVLMVFTQPDRAKDRGKKVKFTPVKELAKSHGTPVLQPDKVKGNAYVAEELKKLEPDIIVVAAYGQLLPEEILNLPKYGCINVHASLLPKLRGASPIQSAIITGEKESGVTIMQMAKGLDTGDMLSSESINIEGFNGSRLHDALADIGGKLLIRTMDKISKGEIVPVEQEHEKATYAGLISKADGKLDFGKSPEEIERLIRGFDPWPGAFCYYEGSQIKFWRAEASDETARVKNGTVILADKDGLKIACGGKILIVRELQAPGKKRMSTEDYLRGHSIKPGAVFE